MELNLNAGVRNGAAPGAARQAQPAHEQRTEPLTPAERRQQAREDKLELSKEALEYLQGQEEKPETEEAADRPMTAEEKRRQAQAEKLKTVKQMLDMVRQQSTQMKEQSEKQAEALKKSMDKMKKCARIARNIGKGHKVPPEDEKYLLENDPKAYMMAIVLRMMEEEKDKVKSELDDEDTKNESQGMESAGAVEAGGEMAAGGEVSVEAAVE